MASKIKFADALLSQADGNEYASETVENEILDRFEKATLSVVKAIMEAPMDVHEKLFLIDMAKQQAARGYAI